MAEVVKESLEELGWTVETCADGAQAMRKIESTERYDLLILDHQLPGHDGMEIARRARQLPHRRRTPIIMLSGSDVDEEAWHAVADAFLMKPQDLVQLSATVTRLLNQDATGK